ncbi:YesL family protein [Sporosarcina sp. FSL K6-3457]|uniref:YesL family protein n=1 Tax=Sporosarcina sp. FSL K6-3457 TaxID=2978204 RepID=UPI0030FACF5A
MVNTENNPMRGFQIIFDWAVKLAYLNLLWILFSLLGLGIFGIGPATVSMFAVIRKCLRYGTDFSMTREFIGVYRSNFWYANRFMLVLIPAYLFVWIDFAVIRLLPSSFIIDKVVFLSVIMLSLLVVIVTCYVFAVYVHYDLAFWRNFKFAFMIAGISPLSTLMILLGLFVCSIIVLIVPAASLFYFISVPVLIIQVCALRAFKKIPELA